MEDMRIILAFIWVATMLIYLLGDVMRIFAGDFTPGEIDSKSATKGMWFGAAAIMLIPILMVVLTIILENPINKWLNVIVAIILFIFNLVGLKGYKAYDKFLLIISFVFNFLVVWYAWNWV